jgi:hypothetical protein
MCRSGVATCCPAQASEASRLLGAAPEPSSPLFLSHARTPRPSKWLVPMKGVPLAQGMLSRGVLSRRPSSWRLHRQVRLTSSSTTTSMSQPSRSSRQSQQTARSCPSITPSTSTAQSQSWCAPKPGLARSRPLEGGVTRAHGVLCMHTRAVSPLATYIHIALRPCRVTVPQHSSLRVSREGTSRCQRA